LDSYNTILQDEDVEEKTNELLKAKKQELLEMAKVVIPNEEFFRKDLKDENAIINELARLQIKLDLYAYMHRDEIEEIRKKIIELDSIEKTSENKESLLQQINEYEIKYKVFSMHREKGNVEEKDWEDLYKVKFDVLTCDINAQKESPFKDKEIDDSQEFVCYDKILSQKINALLLGTNLELRRVFGESNVRKVAGIIKAILIGKNKEFNTYNVLEDKNLLRLLLAFDKENGIEEFTINKHIIQGLNEETVEWANMIPVATISKIRAFSEIYYNADITLQGKDEKENEQLRLFMQLFDLYRNPNSEPEDENTHIIPEGVSIIKDIDVYFKLKASKIKVNAPGRKPALLITLVVPALPLPISLTSFFRNIVLKITAKFILPIK